MNAAFWNLAQRKREREGIWENEGGGGKQRYGGGVQTVAGKKKKVPQGSGPLAGWDIQFCNRNRAGVTQSEII